jgi:hypothetical protein
MKERAKARLQEMLDEDENTDDKDYLMMNYWLQHFPTPLRVAASRIKKICWWYCCVVQSILT